MALWDVVSLSSAAGRQNPLGRAEQKAVESSSAVPKEVSARDHSASKVHELLARGVPLPGHVEAWLAKLETTSSDSKPTILLVLRSVEDFELLEVGWLSGFCRSQKVHCLGLLAVPPQPRWHEGAFQHRFDVPFALHPGIASYPQAPNIALYLSGELLWSESLQSPGALDNLIVAVQIAKGLMDHNDRYASETIAAVLRLGELKSQARALESKSVAPFRTSWVVQQEKPTVVNFWGTWCKPCLDELPILADLSRRYAGHALVVGLAYELSLDAPDAAVRRVVGEAGATYPQYLVSDLELYREVIGESSEFPAFAIFDAEGALRVRFTGSLMEGNRLDLIETSLAYLSSDKARQPTSSGARSAAYCLDNLNKLAVANDDPINGDSYIGALDLDVRAFFEKSAAKVGVNTLRLLAPLFIELQGRGYSREEAARVASNLHSLSIEAIEGAAGFSDVAEDTAYLYLYVDPFCETCLVAYDQVALLRELCPEFINAVEVLPVGGGLPQLDEVAILLEVARTTRFEDYSRLAEDVMTVTSPVEKLNRLRTALKIEDQSGVNSEALEGARSAVVGRRLNERIVPPSAEYKRMLVKRDRFDPFGSVASLGLVLILLDLNAVQKASEVGNDE